MNVFFRALHGPTDWGWIQSKVQILRSEDTSGIVAIDLDKNETVGAIVFDNWTPNCVQAHIVIDKPMLLRHGFIEEGCDFVFNHCKRKIVLGGVKSDNIKALKLDKNMGFKEVYRIKDGYSDGIDYVFLEMRKENCRFLEPAKENANGMGRK